MLLDEDLYQENHMSILLQKLSLAQQIFIKNVLHDTWATMGTLLKSSVFRLRMHELQVNFTCQ